MYIYKDNRIGIALSMSNNKELLKYSESKLFSSKKQIKDLLVLQDIVPCCNVPYFTSLHLLNSDLTSEQSV